MGIRFFAKVYCDNCPRILLKRGCKNKPAEFGGGTTAEAEKNAAVAARERGWYVDAKHTLCESCGLPEPVDG